MKRPAIFFDRDNTLIVSNGYLGDPSQVELVSGAADAIARARDLGYAIIVFSNQSGVARGLFTEDDVHAVNRRIDEALREDNRNAIVDRHSFCPYHPEAVLEEYRRDSDLRKPNPGMIHQAAQTMELDLARSWVIGDATRDIEAGKAAKCRTILFTDPSLPRSPAAQAELAVDPDYRVESLREAVETIERVSEPLHQRVTAQPVMRDTVPMPEDDAPGLPPFAGALHNDPIRATATPTDTRLERLTEQILHELRRRREEPPSDFSVPRLLGGITQVVALATAFMAYLNRGGQNLTPLLLLAVFFQLLTIALLIMGRLR